MRRLRVIGRPAPASLEARLDRQVDRLDRLMADVRAGLGSAAAYNAAEEQAQGIARGLVNAFRTR